MQSLWPGQSCAPRGFHARQERNLLSVAYKNVVGARRASLRIIGSIQQKEEGKGDSQKVEMITAYKAKVEMELNTICNDILQLLKDILIKDSLQPEPKGDLASLPPLLRRRTASSSPPRNAHPLSLRPHCFEASVRVCLNPQSSTRK